MGIATKVNEVGVPVLVGCDEDRAEMAVFASKIKKDLERKASDPYSEDIAILQDCHTHLFRIKKEYATFLWRVLYIFYVSFLTRRLRKERLNLNHFSSEQVVVLVHWNLEVAAVLPFMFYARRAQRYAEKLIQNHHYRFSEKPCWEQAYYHYLNGRAAHVRQGSPLRYLHRYNQASVIRHVESSLRLCERWTGLAEGRERLYAAQSCVYRKAHVGIFYLEIAKRVRSTQGELKFLSKKVLTEALELAEGYAQDQEEAEKLRTLLQKLAA